MNALHKSLTDQLAQFMLAAFVLAGLGVLTTFSSALLGVTNPCYYTTKQGLTCDQPRCLCRTITDPAGCVQNSGWYAFTNPNANRDECFGHTEGGEGKYKVDITAGGCGQLVHDFRNCFWDLQEQRCECPAFDWQLMVPIQGGPGANAIDCKLCEFWT
jgi:hypothetical protein